MTYIQDNDGDFTKKCETETCPNEIFIGVSRTHCMKCLELEGAKPIFKLVPYFEQTRIM